MDTSVATSTFVQERRGSNTVHHHRNVSAADVLHILEEPGEVLKRSRKSLIRRAGPCVVKSSLPGLMGFLRLTFSRQRYRRGWVAAQHLEQHGVGIPKTIAYVERGFLGLLFANHLVSEYLEGHRDSEQYLARLINMGAGKASVAAYLNNLAAAINALIESGACHHDLSGKNIYTRDGENFLFIDLDDVSVGEPYTEELRLKNLVQLYDSFCDLLSDAVLVPFMLRLLPPDADARVWMPKVRKGQQLRRRQHEDKNPGAPRPMLRSQGTGAGGGASQS